MPQMHSAKQLQRCAALPSHTQGIHRLHTRLDGIAHTHADAPLCLQFAKEGEELSKKQLTLESSAKKLRTQLKESEHLRKELDTNLLLEQQKVMSIR